MRNVCAFFLVGAVLISLTGCARITSQVVEKPRLDQEIQGNRGYLAGSGPSSTGARKTTRRIVQTDIELPTGRELNPWWVRTETPAQPQAPSHVPAAPAQPLQMEEEREGERFEPPQAPPRASARPIPAAATYTVKKGDNLEKISKSAYGDARYWRQIYEANRDVLSSPNRLYPGQKLVIPALETGQGETSGFSGDLK